MNYHWGTATFFQELSQLDLYVKGYCPILHKNPEFIFDTGSFVDKLSCFFSKRQ